MPNEYSIAIHDYITSKITANKQSIERAKSQSPYHEGQLKELLWIRQYLKENVDLSTYTYYK
jgi:hypothetical protein